MNINDFEKWKVKESSGLRKTKEIHNVIVEVNYQPLMYLNMKKDARYKDDDKIVVFGWKISAKHPQINIFEELQNANHNITLLSYLSFNIKDKLNLVYSNDTVSCVVHSYEQNYGIDPFITMTSVFDVSVIDNIDDDFIFFYDAVDIGLGIIKIEFDRRKINNIPIILN